MELNEVTPVSIFELSLQEELEFKLYDNGMACTGRDHWIGGAEEVSFDLYQWAVKHNYWDSMVKHALENKKN